MAIITDRRSQGGNGSQSRDDVIRRHKKAIVDAIRKDVVHGDLKRLGKDGLDVVLPKKDLRQPGLGQGPGGSRTYVQPGNKEYSQGDRIERPPGGGSGGPGQKGGDGDDQDSDISIHLNKEEYLKILFEDLGLPNLNIINSLHPTRTELKYIGVVNDGSPENLNYEAARVAQIGRRNATTKKDKRKILELLREEKSILCSYHDAAAKPLAFPHLASTLSLKIRIEKTEARVRGLKKQFGDAASPAHKIRISEIDAEIDVLKKKISSIPYYDKLDKRYDKREQQPVPSPKAVMMRLMDVSGSMDENRRYKAQAFFFLLYLFLERNYGEDAVDIVNVVHTTTAKEVDNETFMNEQKYGGTTVSTGLQLCSEIQKDRYPESEWNVYLAQASDGDNDYRDDPQCVALLSDFLKKAQAAFYVEITEGDPQSLWGAYEGVKKKSPDKFWMGRIKEQTDVLKVFRQFFTRNSSDRDQARMQTAFHQMYGPA